MCVRIRPGWCWSRFLSQRRVLASPHMTSGSSRRRSRSTSATPSAFTSPSASGSPAMAGPQWRPDRKVRRRRAGRRKTGHRPRRDGSSGVAQARRAGDLVRRLSQQAQLGRARAREVRRLSAGRRAGTRHRRARGQTAKSSARARTLLAKREVAAARRHQCERGRLRQSARPDLGVRPRSRSGRRDWQAAADATS